MIIMVSLFVSFKVADFTVPFVNVRKACLVGYSPMYCNVQ